MTAAQKSTAAKQHVGPARQAPTRSNLLALPVDTNNAYSRRRDTKAASKGLLSDRPSSAVHSRRASRQGSPTGSAAPEKKRGRKREQWDKYVAAARDKIREFKAKLKTAKRDKIDVKERQKWRNVVSAQQSRLKKKQEVRFLNSVIRRKDDGIETLMDIIGHELESIGQLGILANILRRAQDEIAPVDKDTVDEFKELQAILEDYDIPDPEEDLEEE